MSLNEWMIGYLLTNDKISPDTLSTFRPSVLNRLDRNTSGIVLCGTTLFGSRILSVMIRERSIKKTYLAVVLGKYDETGVRKAFLDKGSGNHVAVYPAESPHPETAKAIEHHVKSAHYDADKNITLLEIELITGRSHQIRAYFSAAGHPVLGDPKYGDPEANRYFRKKCSIRYQLLHAYQLSLSDNATDVFGYPVATRFTATPPDFILPLLAL